MRWLLEIVGTGMAFWIGAILLAAAVVLRARARGAVSRSLALIFATLGAAVIAFSATPLPTLLYAVLALAFITWIFIWSAQASRRTLSIVTEAALLVLIVVSIAWELPCELRPRIPASNHTRLYVVGDSISAGIGTQFPTWPALFRTQHPTIEVIDLSHAGLGCAQELKRIQDQPLDNGLVLVEIGGNDLIARIGPERFGRDLDALVRHLSAPGRTLVMLELPLFPFDNAYGAEQRRVARANHVILIPKRYFASVLATKDATLDGLHLSPLGQQAMSAMLWDLIANALAHREPATSTRAQ